MQVSVVIPTLDESARIGGTIGSVGQCASEIIVVDGGSRDDTRRLAREAGALVLDASAQPGGSRGRAHQLRLGGERARGDVILFLHADTALPEGWFEGIRTGLLDPQVAGGAFGLRFAERGGSTRWIEGWARIRVAIFGLPYGDQALFMRRHVLERMGGVPIVAIMEDLDLVRGIKAAGRLVQVPLRVTTSARRYRAQGTLRTLLRHQVALLGWFLGFDRARLAGWMQR